MFLGEIKKNVYFQEVDDHGAGRFRHPFGSVFIGYGDIGWIVDLTTGFFVKSPELSADPAAGVGFGPDVWRAYFTILGINVIIFLAYYVVIPVLMNGQTLAKKMVGIRIVRVNGKPLPWWTMFLREAIGKTISTLILFIGFLIALGKEKKALHDYIAGTAVVYRSDE
ncbi:RDD family protein [Ferviditalea candida]|uniref:RDD family protein n=1 Tax=Ferviditalea candida TaxID=3108399 RepID=UPI00352EA69B